MATRSRQGRAAATAEARGGRRCSTVAPVSGTRAGEAVKGTFKRNYPCRSHMSPPAAPSGLRSALAESNRLLLRPQKCGRPNLVLHKKSITDARCWGQVSKHPNIGHCILLFVQGHPSCFYVIGLRLRSCYLATRANDSKQGPSNCHFHTTPVISTSDFGSDR